MRRETNYMKSAFYKKGSEKPIPENVITIRNIGNGRKIMISNDICIDTLHHNDAWHRFFYTNPNSKEIDDINIRGFSPCIYLLS